MIHKPVENNSDFIFIYEAKQTNPNGDPDMENKPRMDYDTKTNLVTKYKEKRTIRDFLKFKGKKIFVDTVNDNKVGVESRVKIILNEFAKKNKKPTEIRIFQDMKDDIKAFIGEFENKTTEEVIDALDKNTKELIKKKDKSNIRKISEINNNILEYIIKDELIDIRLFGGTFAIEGYTRTYTGPVQINWGYSLHPVQLMKSNALVTIMNDGDSMFGKSHNVEYSLIAFNGTVSKNMAEKTGMTVEDKKIFRKAIVESLSSNPTSSKGNQYPILYLELEYENDFDGFLYDMRNLIDKEHNEIVRSLDDIHIKIERLIQMIEDNRDIIKTLYYWESPFVRKEKMVFTEALAKLKEKQFKVDDRFEKVFANKIKGIFDEENKLKNNG